MPAIPLLDPASLTLPPVYAQSYAGTLLARPVFLSATQADQIGRDLRTLCDLLLDLPTRLCEGRLADFAELLRIPESLRPLVATGDVRQLPIYARADLIDEGDRFQLVELNFGSELGGLDAAQMNRAWLAAPGFTEFARSSGLEYVDTAAHTVALLRQAAARVKAADARFVLVEARDALAEHLHVFVSIREALAELGIEIELAEIHQLEPDGHGGISLAGAPVDVVLRYFSSGELVGDDEAIEKYRLLEAADSADRTALVSSLSAACLASKSALAILHAPDTQTVLSSDERHLVERLVPWTALVADLDEGTRQAVSRDREDYVIKPGIGYGGVGTFIGAQESAPTWEEALQHAAGSDGVVQRRVLPAAEFVVNPATGITETWHANWGVFVTDEGYAGGFVRALKPTEGTIIGYANPGTRGAPIFTYPDNTSAVANAAEVGSWPIPVPMS